MKLLKQTLGTVCLLIAGFTSSASSYAETLNYNIFTLSADARREIPNDLMQVTLSVQHQALSANSASSKVNRDMAWALRLLKNKKNIKFKTSNYSTNPIYEKSRINAWSARQNLQLSSSDFDNLSDVIGELQERLAVNQMSFTAKPSTRDKVQNELISEALAAYKMKALIVQKSMSAKAYDIVKLDINPRHQQPEYRGRMMMAMAEAAPAPVAVQSGKSTISITVSGQIQLKGF